MPFLHRRKQCPRQNADNLQWQQPHLRSQDGYPKADIQLGRLVSFLLPEELGQQRDGESYAGKLVGR
jgi:hypothetical protein